MESAINLGGNNKESLNDKSKMMVLGIGKGGCNIIDAMRQRSKLPHLKDALYVFADCDIYNLEKHISKEGNRHILLDANSEEFPDDIFCGIEQLIIVAGMGGFTGSKYSILAVEAARKAGIKLIRFVGLIGFLIEGKHRVLSGIKTLKAIAQIEGVAVMAVNNEMMVDKFVNNEVSEAFYKFNIKLVREIENAQIMRVRYWKEYPIIGNPKNINHFVDCVETKKISRYDVLHALSSKSYNFIGASECTEFAEAFQEALRDIPLEKIDKLLIYCDGKNLSIANFKDIYTLHSQVFAQNFQLKLDIFNDDNQLDKLKLLLVASSEKPDFGIFHLSV